MSTLTGKFNDIYHDYKYTYMACGFVLVVGSLFLFIGMGINYRLLHREAKEESKRAKLQEEPGKEVKDALKVPNKNTAEDGVWHRLIGVILGDPYIYTLSTLKI